MKRDHSKLQQGWANRKTAVSDVFKVEPETDPGAPKVEKSPDERKQLFAQVVQSEISKGAGRIESQGGYYVTLVRGHRPNHILHLILSIITLGLWIIVWIPVAMGSGEKRMMVSVDEYGYVTTRRISRLDPRNSRSQVRDCCNPDVKVGDSVEEATFVHGRSCG